MCQELNLRPHIWGICSIIAPYLQSYKIIFCFLGATPSGNEGLFLSQCKKIISGGTWGTMWNQWLVPGFLHSGMHFSPMIYLSNPWKHFFSINKLPQMKNYDQIAFSINIHSTLLCPGDYLVDLTMVYFSPNCVAYLSICISRNEKQKAL